MAATAARVSQLEDGLHVYTVFRRWRIGGVWQRIHDTLRCAVRRAAGKPRKAIVDSQSARTAEGGEERGYDAAKKVAGRRRHLAVDSLGLIWSLIVHGAYWQDHDGAAFVMFRLRQQVRRLAVVSADSAYARNGLVEWVRETFR
jgi:putative transposase